MPEELSNPCVDLIGFSDFNDTDWEAERLVVPDCGHPMTASYLDGQLKMQLFYNAEDGSENARWIAIKPILSAYNIASTNSGDINVLCPTCREPIRGIRRYGRLMNAQNIIKSQHRVYVTFQQQTSDLLQRLDEPQADLNGILHDLNTLQRELNDFPLRRIQEAEASRRIP